TLAAGEERARDLREVAFHGRERLREAPLDRLRQLAAELVELGERALEVAALRPQLLEVLLLALVLLLRERVDAAQRLAAALEPDELRLELLARALRCRLRRGLVEPAPRLGRLRLQPRQPDLDRRRPLAGAPRLP